MSFLVPAFLAGLAALAIPVLVHLTRKRKAEVRAFPSLMFLERAPYRAESRRRIEHWMLLLLRAAAVLLVVLAFARPFFDDDAAAAGATGGPSEVVVLVDRSWSMTEGDRFARALDAARDVVGRLGPLDRASVVFFDDGAGVAVRSSTDRSRLLAALDTAAPGDRATRYGPGLKLAQAILDESELPSGEVVLIGDFQRTGWTGEEGVRLRPGTTVTPVAVADSAPANRAVADVELARETFQGRERLTPTARITRTGGEEPEEVEVVLEVDGREAERRTVTLPPEGAEAVAFEPFTLTARHTRGTVRLASDALPADDARHFVVSPGEALPVLLLDDGSRGASSLYLERALRVETGRAFDVRLRSGGAVGPAELPERGVVLVNDRAVPPTSARALRDFVEDGGGLLLVLGERAAWPDEVDGVIPGRIGQAVDRTGRRGGRLGHLDYDHPIFEVFRGPRSGDFTAARFFRARGFTPADDPSVRVLARYDDGTPALVEGAVGEGRVLVWTSTLDAFWNDLALQPVFLPFVHRAVQHVSGRAEALPSFEAGQVIDVTDARAMATAGLGAVVGDAAAGAGGSEPADERVVVTPSGATRPLAELPAAGATPAGPAGAAGSDAADADPGDGSRRPAFLALDEAGFYLIRPAGSEETRPLAVAVNVDLTEADPGTLDPAEVAASLTADDATAAAGTPVTAAGADALRREDRERRQSLWRFLLVGAFALLALESVLANRIGRRRRTAPAARGGT